MRGIYKNVESVNLLRKEKQVRQYEFESDHLIKLLGISEGEKITEISLGHIFVNGRTNPVTILITTERYQNA